MSPAGDAHPGTVELVEYTALPSGSAGGRGQATTVDHVEHRTWREPAASLPQTMTWEQLDGTWIPVVRIAIVGDGDRREMTWFGPRREFLSHTTALLHAH